ncbi:hypothetical protein Bca52824_091892 [Brassica carinata]|uniref:Uncharacterized protein n=1 Tax=Brassica carinata TaxID=52824 RepID=A0A8X7NTK6_BRACI|nr:hypothetical protein Bca52824_091892 [Brassica carinata]
MKRNADDLVKGTSAGVREIRAVSERRDMSGEEFVSDEKLRAILLSQKVEDWILTLRGEEAHTASKALLDENEWWIFPVALFLCKVLQSQLVNWHVANLEIQDYSLYSDDSELFWQS